MSRTISDDEDVVKHAKAMYVHGDQVDGFAFLPRPLPADHDGSSVNRLCLFSTDDDEAMAGVRTVFRLQCKAGHRFAQINVGALRRCLKSAAGIGIDVVAAPLKATDRHPSDPSHALIRHLPPPGILDDFVGDLIRENIKRVHSAV